MFYVHAVRNLSVPAIFEMPARPAGFENFRLWSIGGSDSLLRYVRSAPEDIAPDAVVDREHNAANLDLIDFSGLARAARAPPRRVEQAD